MVMMMIVNRSGGTGHRGISRDCRPSPMMMSPLMFSRRRSCLHRVITTDARRFSPRALSRRLLRLSGGSVPARSARPARIGPLDGTGDV